VICQISNPVEVVEIHGGQFAVMPSPFALVPLKFHLCPLQLFLHQFPFKEWSIVE
jgi:hypothetical protein